MHRRASLLRPLHVSVRSTLGGWLRVRNPQKMLSVPHLVIIFLVALIVLGPDKLPQIARSLGKAMADFRRVTTDFRVQIEDEMREMERQARIKEMNAESVRTAEEASTQLLGAPPAEEPQHVPATAVTSEKPANGESQPV